MPLRQQMRFFIIGVVCSLATRADAAQQEVPAVGVVAGDYELTASTDSIPNAKRERRGHLVLRDLIVVRELFGTPCRLYGWTDVDFRSLGAPIAKSDTPPDSKDPENPGVLVLEPTPAFAKIMKSMKLRKTAEPPGAPIMLIGTVENKRTTRGMRDGGGIGLFVEAQEGQCVLGRWSRFGIAAGSEGAFKLCRVPGRRPTTR